MQGLPKQIFGFMEIRAKSFCRFIIFPFKTSFIDPHHLTSDILQDFLDRRSRCKGERKGLMADILAEINQNATLP
jgi:hypothetical protein